MEHRMGDVALLPAAAEALAPANMEYEYDYEGAGAPSPAEYAWDHGENADGPGASVYYYGNDYENDDSESSDERPVWRLVGAVLPVAILLGLVVVAFVMIRRRRRGSGLAQTQISEECPAIAAQGMPRFTPAGSLAPAAPAVAPHQGDGVPPDFAQHLEALGVLRATSRAPSAFGASAPIATASQGTAQVATSDTAPAAVVWAVSGSTQTGKAPTTAVALDVLDAAVKAEAKSVPQTPPLEQATADDKDSMLKQRSVRAEPLVGRPDSRRAWECPVCMEGGAEALVSLHCGHVMHGDCMLRALAAQRVCPVCREPVEITDDIRRVFL